MYSEKKATPKKKYQITRMLALLWYGAGLTSQVVASRPPQTISAQPSVERTKTDRKLLGKSSKWKVGLRQVPVAKRSVAVSASSAGRAVG